MNFRAEEYDAGAPATCEIHHTNQREEERNRTAGQASKSFAFDFESHLGIRYAAVC